MMTFQVAAVMAANEATMVNSYDVPQASSNLDPLSARAASRTFLSDQREARASPAIGVARGAIHGARGKVKSVEHTAVRFAAARTAQLEELADWTESMESSEGKDDESNARDQWTGVAYGTGVSGEQEPAFNSQDVAHEIQHEFLATSTGPATGDAAGKAGTGFTGATDNTVWHSDWSVGSSSASSTDSGIGSGSDATSGWGGTTAAGLGVAQQEATLPPGAGVRGPPQQSTRGSGGGVDSLAPTISQAVQQSGPTASCQSEQITLCKAGCSAKANLGMGIGDSAGRGCVSRCLGPCASSLGYEAEAAAAIGRAMQQEAKLIDDLSAEMKKTDPKGGSGAGGSSQADKVAQEAVARLEKRIVQTSGTVDDALDKVQDEMSHGKVHAEDAPAAGLASNGAGVWHAPGDEDISSGGGAPWRAAPAANGAKSKTWTPAAPAAAVAAQAGSSWKGAASGSRLYPQPPKQAAGELTGVYDCRGEALKIGSVVGRMVKGQPCEDRIMVVTGGEWKVTGFKQPNEAELENLQPGQTPDGRVAVIMHGVTGGVNKGTRIETLPVLGAFTSWKIVHGAAADLFLPANIAVLKAKGKHNVAGTPGAWEAAQQLSSGTQAGGKLESVFDAARSQDWGQTGVTEKEDANLDICPGARQPRHMPGEGGVHAACPISTG